ncbi:MAG: hypothetical protein HQ505_01815 [Nitrosopumilus sp.]|nr:hypothetical protein [Nitrosopumilus sp.]
MSFNSKTFEMKKEIVNHAVRICIECGSRSIQIDNSIIYCKNCNSKFRISPFNAFKDVQNIEIGK